MSRERASQQADRAPQEGDRPVEDTLGWACGLLFEGRGETRWLAGRARRSPGERIVEAYAVLPSRSAPRLLVPLPSRAVALAAMRSYSVSSSPRSRLGKALLVAGLSNRRARSLLARRGVRVAVGSQDAVAGSSALIHHLRQALGHPDLQMAVMLGPYRQNRKPVLQILSGDGSEIGYAKVGWNELTRQLVRDEAATLRRLELAAPVSFRAPRLLHAGPWEGLEISVATALPHAPWHRLARADAPFSVAAEIARLGGVSTARLAESHYWTGVGERVARLSASGAAVGIAEAARRLERRFGAMELAFGTWHGDLTPWNMAVTGEATYVWDWERSNSPVPLGFDLAHFAFQSAFRYGSRNARLAVEQSGPSTARLLDRLGAPAGSEQALWWLYQLELLVRYAEARAAGATDRESLLHQGLLDQFERMEAIS